MPSPDQDQIVAALKTVLWNGAPLTESGMIAGVSLAAHAAGARASIMLDVHGRDVKAIEELQKAIEAAVARVPGIVAVSVGLTAHQAKPAVPARQSHVPQKLALPGVRHIVAVASGKGGVGKSTTAVNLALALAARGLRVGLLDADIYGPSAPRMLGLTGSPEIDADKKMIPHEAFGIAVMSMGFLVAEEQAMVWRGPMVHTALTQLFRDVAWGVRDVLIVDMPPGTGDAHLTLAQSVPVTGAVIVSTPQDIALLDARKAVTMFARTGVPILGLIENMSFFQCPKCGERTDLFGHGGARAEALKLNLPYLGGIPLHLDIRTSGDAGVPIAGGQNELAHLYGEIAATISQRLA